MATRSKILSCVNSLEKLHEVVNVNYHCTFNLKFYYFKLSALIFLNGTLNDELFQKSLFLWLKRLLNTKNTHFLCFLELEFQPECLDHWAGNLLFEKHNSKTPFNKTAQSSSWEIGEVPPQRPFQEMVPASNLTSQEHRVTSSPGLSSLPLSATEEVWWFSTPVSKYQDGMRKWNGLGASHSSAPADSWIVVCPTKITSWQNVQKCEWSVDVQWRNDVTASDESFLGFTLSSREALKAARRLGRFISGSKWPQAAYIS